VTLLTVRNLRVSYPTRTGTVEAVRGISFTLGRERLGIVGESGSGKSQTGRAIMGLTPPNAIISADRLEFGGIDLIHATPAQRRALRGNRVAMVLQDPKYSLNPVMTIGRQIAETLLTHERLPRAEVKARVIAMLAAVRISDPERVHDLYPHEVSGGMGQRVNIARALALNPRLLILDEAVSALDKSVEAQVLNLLMDLREEFELTYMFISHDLNVVRLISDRVMVMYLGEVVEIGPVEAIFANPGHPYTRALLSAMPSMDPDARTMEAPLTGDPPNPINPPSGCRFHPRCAFAEPICAAARPALTGRDGQLVACHMAIAGARHPAAPEAMQ